MFNILTMEDEQLNGRQEKDNGKVETKKKVQIVGFEKEV